MVKSCSHGLCNSDTRHADRPHMKGVFFVRFPNKKTRLNDCEIWVKACNRVNFTISSVKNFHFICSKHFVGGNGPTKEHPHPVIATSTQARYQFVDGQYQVPSSRTRKKLLPLRESLQNEENEMTVTRTEHDTKVSETVQEQETNKSDQNWTLLGTPPEQILCFPELQSIQRAEERVDVTVDVSQAVPTCANNENKPLSLQIVEVVSVVNNLPAPREFLTPEVMAVALGHGWAFHFNQSNNLVFLKVRNEVVTMALELNHQLRLQLRVNGETLNEAHPLSSELSSQYTSTANDLVRVLVMISKSTTCQGVSGREYLSLYFGQPPVKDCRLIYQTVSLHSFKCQQVIPSNRTVCAECRLLKLRLGQKVRRRNEACSASLGENSKCNIRYLPMSEIQRRMRVQRAKLMSSSMKLKRLQHKMQEDD